MGRPRKTPQELELAGTNPFNPSRKTWNTKNQRPLTDRLAPAHYLRRTQIAWAEFMDMKAAQGVLSEEDRSCVIEMFDCLDRLYRNTDTYNEIRKNNPNYFDFLLDKDNRDAVKHLRAEMNADDTAFRNWAIRFGMTPTERSKLPMMPEKPQSEMLQLIKRAKDKDAKAQ